MAEKVPYFDSMGLGQGFNTYLQVTCVDDAVTVTEGSPVSPPVKAEYYSEEIRTYEQLVQSLSVSAGAAVSGWGQSARVDSRYLNKTEFQESTITFQVRVKCENQGRTDNNYSFNKYETTDPHTEYGNRFIADFVEGGEYFARVSITSKSQSNKREVEDSAKIAVQMYGASGEITTEVKTALDHLSKEARTEVYDVLFGRQVAVDEDPAEHPLELIRKRAIAFYDSCVAGKQDFKLFAVLWEYHKVPNFDNYFEPYDYSSADLKSWALFNDFTSYVALLELINNVPPEKFKDGDQKQRTLMDDANSQMDIIQKKVKVVSKDPSSIDVPVVYTLPNDFKKNTLLAIKRILFYAQQREVGSGQVTDVALPYQQSGAKTKFAFEAYDFEQVLGTSVVSFGRSQGGESYICLSGDRASNFSGYTEESFFWVFSREVQGAADLNVVVSKQRTAELIQLDIGVSPFPELFRFFASQE